MGRHRERSESGVRSFYDLETRESSLARSIVGVLLGPLLGLVNRAILVVLPVVGNSLIKRVVYVGCGHKGLDGEEDGFDLEGGGPLVLEDVEADTA